MEANDVIVLAERLREEKEELYGVGAWRSLGLSGCLEAANRKAIYLKAQMTDVGVSTPKFREDLLDLINWSAFTYCLSVEGSNGTSTNRG